MRWSYLMFFVAHAVTLWLGVSSPAISAAAEDWPMLGRDGTRNAVSLEEGAPTAWCVEERDRKTDRLIRGPRGVRWSAPLGWSTFSSPVVSSGLVWIGTNYGRYGVQDTRGFDGVLKCFRASDGMLLYEHKSPAFGDRWVRDTVWGGIGSSPLIEGDRLWLVTNRSVVLCLDIGPLIRNEGMPRELWKLDMVAELDIFHRSMLMGPPRTCSIGPSWNGRVFITTSNGVDETYLKVPKPGAPSLVCLDKNTGKVLWSDNSPGSNILTTQFSSPTVATLGGQVQVIVPQSDGWLRAFDPDTGEKLWEFDLNYKLSRLGPGGLGDRNYPLANAVVYEDRVYIAAGREPENGEGAGRLVCLDPRKRGDISSELAVDAKGNALSLRRLQAVVPNDGERAVPNPNSGLIWEFVGKGKEFEDQMHRTQSSVAIHDGLLIAVDFSGLVQCFDARTGQRHWSHDLWAAIWSSPLIVGDKVYVANEDGDMAVFQLGADPKYAEPIATTLHPEPIYSSPIYANGTLYVATRSTLYAIDAAQARRWSERTANWPQWRGPERDNRSSDTGLLTSWPAQGPPLLWRVDALGDGIASVALEDGRVFTSTSFDSSEYVVALDEASGERLWTTRVGSTVQESPLMRWLSQRTPTVDGARLFAFTNTGALFCMNAASGHVVWQIDYPREFGTQRGRWGYCDRPLVDGDKLICVPGGSQATVVALDKRAGNVLWKTLLDSREAAAYGASIIVETDGLRQYVVVLDTGLASFAADDGRLLWRYDGVSTGIGNTYTPIALGDGLLCPNGYKTGIARLKLTRRDNEVIVEPVYRRSESLDPFEDSTVVVDNRLYAFLQSGMPLCFDINDGSRLWGPVRPAAVGKTAATYADGHLYTRGTRGMVGLVEASATGYVEKGRFTLPEPREAVGATFPVVAGGRLYVRDNDRLYCFDVSRQSDGQTLPAPKLIQWTIPQEGAPKSPPTERVADAIFVPTPHDVVEKMLAAAKLNKDDVVYDLGSGDGRIVIAAAKTYGCRAVGLEIAPDLVKLSRESAQQAGLEKLVTIREADLFTADFLDATVVAAYLYPALLKRLLPKLQELNPGTRIVAHQFAIPGFPPEETITVQSEETGGRHTVYLWTAPLKK